MSLLLRPASFRIASTRAFSTTSSPRASLLFALSALSNQQETQHFAKHSRLSRVEHSPALELIRSSEVKPFAKQDISQAVSRDAIVEPAKNAAPVLQAETYNISSEPQPQLQPQIQPILQHSPPVDAAVLQTLQQMSTQLATLEAKLVEMGIETEKDVRRTGALVTVLVAGAVAGLAVWKFWPPESVRREGDFARRHVQERSRVIPSDVVGHHHPAAASNVAAAAAMGEPAVFRVAQPAAGPVSVSALKSEERAGSWWRSLFWREQ